MFLDKRNRARGPKPLPPSRTPDPGPGFDSVGCREVIRILQGLFVVYPVEGAAGLDKWRIMSSFTARLHLPGQTKLPLSVEVDIDDERMVLSAGRRQVADWALAEVEVAAKADGLHLKVDHEELVLNADDPVGLARVLGASQGGNEPRLPHTTLSSPSKTMDTAVISEMLHDELRQRIAEVARMLNSKSVAPSDVFAKWLRLLKDINRRHGQGSLPARMFYELNTELLDLIPEPSRSTEPAR
jgi:hypothetical protein